MACRTVIDATSYSAHSWLSEGSLVREGIFAGADAGTQKRS